MLSLPSSQVFRTSDSEDLLSQGAPHRFGAKCCLYRAHKCSEPAIRRIYCRREPRIDLARNVVSTELTSVQNQRFGGFTVAGSPASIWREMLSLPSSQVFRTSDSEDLLSQ